MTDTISPFVSFWRRALPHATFLREMNRFAAQRRWSWRPRGGFGAYMASAASSATASATRLGRPAGTSSCGSEAAQGSYSRVFLEPTHGRSPADRGDPGTLNSRASRPAQWMRAVKVDGMRVSASRGRCSAAISRRCRACPHTGTTPIEASGRSWLDAPQILSKPTASTIARLVSRGNHRNINIRGGQPDGPPRGGPRHTLGTARAEPFWKQISALAHRRTKT